MAAKILLVEDDENFRGVLALALELQGYSVRQAACGRRAIEALEEETPDIIISDLEMGAFDGRALCKYTRATPGLAQIPFVILSAFVEAGTAHGLPDLPADRFLSKQTPISELTGLVRELLERSGNH